MTVLRVELRTSSVVDELPLGFGFVSFFVGVSFELVCPIGATSTIV